jgi:DNA-binding MarR family transcriptional regulator
MKIKIAADSTYKYLQVFNGIFELTDKELLVLSYLIDLKKTTNLCSAKNKKLVAEKLGIQDYSTLNNYVKRLKDKGAIITTPDGYKLTPVLESTTEIQIVR